ncbi:MAG TPA: hypothetical protein VGM65_13475 [Candidatus Udaeobacter sp.]
MQILHDLASLREREPPIELQSVRASWNPRTLPTVLFGHIMPGGVETPISNDEIRMTNDETNPNKNIQNDARITAESFVI